ncbi:MAG TPA: hypothetical protein VK622_08795 [Puia sp.]|nr:hypothetical protein [Puia sp.]
MQKSDLIVIVFGILIIGILVLSVLLHIRKNRQLAMLWEAYNAAKANGDRAKALEAGRAYYKRRRGKLNNYDEQAIASDLNTMN